MAVVAMTCGEFHGYLADMLAAGFQGQVCYSSQDPAPIQAKDEDSETSAVQNKTNPIKV